MVRNTLRKKLYRDMLRAAMQFASIIALCMLGTFAFSVLDGTARMVRQTITVYFEENNLADFWVTVPSGVDRAVIDKLRDVPGVEIVRPRAVMDLETPLGDDINVCVTAYDGEMDVNIPYFREGEMLSTTDKRGCLIDDWFAQAQGLGIGDRISVKLSGMEYSFVIRGIVVSPEYIIVSNGVASSPETYGYILVNACAIPELPLTQAAISIDKDADADTVERAIQAALPDALVVNRMANRSASRTENDAAMFENMTLIFPVLAYAVAALVVMTTLSRMIDNQRMQMGTLKALGFSAGKIRNHYLSYAVLPSLIGALLGTVIGHNTLPYFLWDALIGEDEMPYRLEPAISLPAWGMVLLTVVMSVAICYYTYKKSARETTAALLRPKPPKDGKRILFERITPLWKRLSFNQKMIVRNLMRNKWRTFMCLVGLLCCNMLIITSFGLQDSVKQLTTDFYTKTLRYDVRASLSGNVGTAESYESRLSGELVECLMESSASLRAPGGTRTVVVTVLGDHQQMQNLGENGTHVDLLPGSVAVTRKLTKTLDIHVGDVIRLLLPGDDEAIEAVVGQIVENNFSQGVYLTRTTWEGLRKGAFTPTAVQIIAPTEATLAKLRNMDEVDKIDFPEKQIEDMLAMLDSLQTVFMILTGIALALAFVICYNMGLMNFVERTREYATLKVLGYHQKEIRSLILNENNIISVFGVALGVWPGYLLTDIIMHSCEPESAFYIGIPSARSVVIACVITFAFSWLLQFMLTRKVKTIDMVEALKSVE